MIRRANAGGLRTVAMMAALLVVCVPAAVGQHRGWGAPGGGPRFSGRLPDFAGQRREEAGGWQRNERPPRPYEERQQERGRQNAPYGPPGRGGAGRRPMPYAGPRPGGEQRPAPNYRPDPYRPAYRSGFGQQGRPEPQQQSQPQYRGGQSGNNSRPAYNHPNPGSGNRNQGNQGGRPGYGYGNQGARPGAMNPTMSPGHLGSWLNQHHDLPVQKQEQLLRSDPSFSRLPAADQQRLMRQLRQVDQMPAQQRERRLARAQAIERLSPQERTHLNQSSRSYKALPPDRQALVKRAFQDLRGVPLDQRQTVLNSARYKGVFTPQERGILSDFLRVEPYEPQH